MSQEEKFLAQGHLKIGRIPYANLFPIFYALEKISGPRGYEFTDGVPSVVNRLLREGGIDVSPSSSIEYLRHGDAYTFLEGHSISSFGPVGSILFFSRKPIEKLDGSTVLASSQSETSVALLHVILRKFYGCACPLKLTSEPLPQGLESYPAYLLIGDDALREANRWPGLHIYDLGEIWYRNTGLPAVFALWIARKDSVTETSRLERFREDLDAAKVRAFKDLKTIASESPLLGILSEEGLVSYWERISYDLDAEHKRGLDLFRRYAEELRLL